MSKDIEPTLWAIQEKALKPSASECSPEEQAAIEEYEKLYQMMEQGKVDDPPMALAQTVTKKVAKHNRRQRASKLFTASLFLILVTGLFLGLFWLLPQSVLFSQISQLIPSPLILLSLTMVCLINYLYRNK